MTLPELVSTELTIIIKEVRDCRRVGCVYHTVSIFEDGSIYAEEIFTDPSTIMFHKKLLRSKLFDTFSEFQKDFPESSEIVGKYIDKRCD